MAVGERELALGDGLVEDGARLDGAELDEVAVVGVGGLGGEAGEAERGPGCWSRMGKRVLGVGLVFAISSPR